MSITLTDDVLRDVKAAIRSRSSQSLVVDVYAAAEEIRLRHGAQDVGLDDIAAVIARLAAQAGCAVEFSNLSSSKTREVPDLTYSA